MGASNARGFKNWDFLPISRFISEMIQESDSYYGMRIGNHIQAFEWCHFQLLWTFLTQISRSGHYSTLNISENGSMYKHIVTMDLHTPYSKTRPRVTLNDLAKYSMTRSTARSSAVSLRQLSFLFSSESGIFHAVTYVHHRFQLQQQGINAVTAQISCDSTERAWLYLAAKAVPQPEWFLPRDAYGAVHIL